MSKKKDETEPIETNKITKEYFDLSKEYTAKYGKETIRERCANQCCV